MRKESFIVYCLLLTVVVISVVVFSALSCYHGSPAQEEAVHGIWQGE
jgi:hypothetical protein